MSYFSGIFLWLLVRHKRYPLGLMCSDIVIDLFLLQVLWILVFIPLIFMSIISIGICVWAVKHERTFEVRSEPGKKSH